MSQRESEAGSARAPQWASSSPANSGMVMSFFSAKREKKRAVRIELGVAAPADRLGDQAAPKAVRRHQVDDKRRRNVEMPRGGPPGMAGFDKIDNPLTKIL